MASEYCILISGPNGTKLTVRAVQAEITGLYDKRDRTITRPCSVDIARLIPGRWRKAFNRTNGRFWFEESAHIDINGKLCGNAPYLNLHDCRGKYMVTLYCIPAIASE